MLLFWLGCWRETKKKFFCMHVSSTSHLTQHFGISASLSFFTGFISLVPIFISILSSLPEKKSSMCACKIVSFENKKMYIKTKSCIFSILVLFHSTFAIIRNDNKILYLDSAKLKRISKKNLLKYLSRKRHAYCLSLRIFFSSRKMKASSAVRVTVTAIFFYSYFLFH